MYWGDRLGLNTLMEPGLHINAAFAHQAHTHWGVTKFITVTIIDYRINMA